MKNTFSVLMTAGLLLSSLLVSPQINAAEQPNILIMGEDADLDSVPRSSRIFKRVLDGISGQLNDDGFNVFDETAVTLDNFAQDRSRRPDNEIIDIARSVNRPPIDVAVIFSIFASSKKTNYTTKIRTRITGRMLNIRSGQRLGNFEVEMPSALNAPHDCNRECLLETVGRRARNLSLDLGAVLTEKLAHLIGEKTKIADGDTNLPTAFQLVFTGFNNDDVNGIEEYLVAFSGYKHHRPTSSSQRNAEYWYETNITSARLNRNLRRMLDHLGVRGRVTFSGNIFNVEKITLRTQR